MQGLDEFQDILHQRERLGRRLVPHLINMAAVQREEKVLWIDAPRKRGLHD